MAPTISSDSGRTKGGGGSQPVFTLVEKCRGMMYDAVDKAALTKNRNGRPTSEIFAADRRG
jgi:hypothetical protein